MGDNVRVETAADRRRRMPVQVHHSFEAHERDDARYWAAIPPDERVRLVWTLSRDQWQLFGDSRDESGLCRSVARVQRP
jgi:hypothetical protein